jgi:hypothetical protein
MSGHHLEILPVGDNRWIVRHEGDPTQIEPDYDAPTPRHVKGPHWEPKLPF